MRKEIRILAIVMIAMFAFSSALAGQTTTIANSDISDPQFVADMDGVLFELVVLEMTFQALQPSIVYTELTNIEDIYSLSGSADIGDYVFVTNYDVSVLKTPTYMLASESRNYTLGANSGDLAGAYSENIRITERVSKAEMHQSINSVGYVLQRQRILEVAQQRSIPS